MKNPFNDIRLFGEGLKEKVILRENRERIGAWTFINYDSGCFDGESSGFYNIISDICFMEEGSGFFKSYEELERIADSAMTGKWLAQQQEVEIDKSYMKISFEYASYPKGWSSYEDHSPEGDYQLYILAELLQILGSEELAQFLKFPEWESQKWNDVFLSKEKDVVHVYSDWGPFYNKEQKQLLSATFNIENLKRIVVDWAKLYEEDKEELIYLIIQGNKIIVRNSLENT